MIQARESRNREAIQKIANKESNKAWGNTPTPEIPKFEVYKTCNGIKNDNIWRNLLRSIIREAKQLRP